MVESTTSNPLPADAEHSPSAPLPTDSSGSNPLPLEAEHNPAPVAPTVSDSNPLPNSSVTAEAKPVETKPATSDLLVPAVGYLPAGIFQFIAALIGLMGQNLKAKFHGAQALTYWLVVGLLYAPVLIVSGILGFSGGVVALIGTVFVLVYVVGLILALPVFLAYKTYKGQDVLLPVVGSLIAEKVGYKP